MCVARLSAAVGHGADHIEQIQRRDGFKALFTGFSLHCTRDTVGTGVYFALNDSFRYLFDRHHVPNVSGTPLAVFASGSLSGLLSWFVIYPIDLVSLYALSALISA